MAPVKYLAAVLTAFALLCGTAHAQIGPFAEEAMVVDPVQMQMRDLAIKFWASRNVTGCSSGITMETAAGLTLAGDAGYVLARGGDCDIVLLPSSYETQWDNSRLRHRWIVKHELDKRCALIVHEVGHALGLMHTPAGVMSADEQNIDVPWDCKMWRRSLPTRPGWSWRLR